MKSFVLDASALLASIYEEKGKLIVDRYSENAIISTVNITEVIEQLIRTGSEVSAIEEIVRKFSIKRIDYNEEHAFIAARLREPTKKLGLSLGDRACLALAITEKLPVLTADKAWKDIKVGVKIQVIR
jgi:PIN domain nuclease of toxin-antitoxin system